jgi:molybdopterin-containing oxidoreductase family membrane subunit
MGLFRDEDRAADAVRGLEQSPWKLVRVHSPIPSHTIAEALKLKKSKVGYFTLAGGILGFFSGFALAFFTATRWSLIVSGKPVEAYIPFFIVGFEFTILFAVLGNVIGMLALTRRSRSEGLKHYDPRCSGEHFGVLAACNGNEEDNLRKFFEGHGGDVRVFNGNNDGKC